MATIVFAADDHYLPYVACSIRQIARFGRRADGVVVCVPADVDDKAVAEVEAVADMHGVVLKVTRVEEPGDLGARRVVYGKKHVTAFVFTKLRLAEILPTLDEVLYLDVDILIRAPLDDLLGWELHHPLGGVVEIAGAGEHIFGTSRQPYFNGGVLRMSLERMRQERIWDQAQLILERRGELVMQEQDVLNLLFRNRFDNLPLVFNVFEELLLEYPKLNNLQDPVIIHFTGPIKPWHSVSHSRYAREWRARYAEALPARALAIPEPRSDAPTGSSRRSTYADHREKGRGRLGSVARAALPHSVKQALKDSAHTGLGHAADQIETLRKALKPTGLKTRKLRAVAVAERLVPEADSHGLDLLISLPRSGTNALGDAIQSSRPGVHWLCDLYGGTPFGLQEDELSGEFPWYATGDPEFRDQLSPAERIVSRRRFAAAMNENAIEITRAVVATRGGRSLIKVFPDQLHASVFEELLTVFRPRLLILRRDMLFSYISLQRATRSNAWRNSDVTDVPYSVSDTDALQYALRADLWIDRVAGLVSKLQLDNVWLTYAGLFTTGEDIALLESFYPGPALPVEDQSAGLKSSLKVQDRRSDASILGMIKAVSALSTITQSQLLRLPGHHVVFE